MRGAGGEVPSGFEVVVEFLHESEPNAALGRGLAESPPRPFQRGW
jgi:hypothetical protein